jgi:hypothetical protein
VRNIIISINLLKRQKEQRYNRKEANTSIKAVPVATDAQIKWNVKRIRQKCAILYCK